MWRVFYGADLIGDPRSDSLVLLDKSLDTALNKTGSFSFSMPPNHPYAGRIRLYQKSMEVSVEEDGECVFRGRAMSAETAFDGSITYECEGDRGYLNDAVLQPYETGVDKVPSTVAGYFNWLVNQYNASQMAPHRFSIGENEGDSIDAGAFYRKSDSRTTVWAEMKAAIVDGLGGYVRTRHDGDVRIIDLLASGGKASAQRIRFGENLMDFTRMVGGADYCTRVYAVGPAPEDEEEEQEEPTDFSRLSAYIESVSRIQQGDKTDAAYDSLRGSIITARNVLNNPETTQAQCDRAYDALYDAVDRFLRSGEEVPDKTLSDLNDAISAAESVERGNKKEKAWNALQGAIQTATEVAESDPSTAEIEKAIDVVESAVETFNASADEDAEEEEKQDSTTLEVLGTRLLRMPYELRDGWVIDADAEQTYGVIEQTREFDDSDPEALLQSALRWLSNVKIGDTMEMTALDLHAIDPEIDTIRVGDYVRATSRPHGFDEYFICMERKYDLDHPENDTFVLGSEYDTLTGAQSKRLAELNGTINTYVDELGDVKETAESKAQVFTEQPVKYRKGDLWVLAPQDGSGSSNILVAVAGNPDFSSQDWTRASDYTNDRAANLAQTAAAKAQRDATQALSDAATAQGTADAIAGEVSDLADELEQYSQDTDAIIARAQQAISDAQDAADAAKAAADSANDDLDEFKSEASATYSTKTETDQKTGAVRSEMVANYATKAENAESTQPNVAPFFGMALDDDTYWYDATQSRITRLSDGWAHIAIDNASGTGAAYARFKPKLGTSEVVPGEAYTFLVEVRDCTVSGSAYVAPSYATATTSEVPCFTGSTNTALANGTYELRKSVTAKDSLEGCTLLSRSWVQAAAGASVELDIRVSLYKGDYQGAYKPSLGYQFAVTRHEMEVSAETLRSTITTAYEAADSELSNAIDTKLEQYTTIEQTDQKIGLSAAQSLVNMRPNLSPFFEADWPTSGSSTDYWGSLSRLAVTQLSDGWAHVEIDNTEGSATAYWYVSPKADVQLSDAEHTLLLETRNVAGNPRFYAPDTSGTAVPQFRNATGISLADEGLHYRRMTPTGNSDPNYLMRARLYLPAGESASFDLRMGFFEGSYTGEWRPYSGAKAYTTKAELTVAADQIESSVIARYEGAGGVLSNYTTLTETDSRISASASSTLDTVSETYATKSALEIESGRIGTLVTTTTNLKSTYATSSTAAGTKAKTATVTPANAGYSIQSGTTVNVTFSNANTANAPTLNVNSTGAKAIVDEKGVAVESGAWSAGETVQFVYNGSQWVMQGSIAKQGIADVGDGLETLEERVATAETSIEQNSESITLNAYKSLALANANLTPFFEADWPEEGKTATDYWKALTRTRITKLQDGWAHVEMDNSAGSGAIYASFTPVADEYLPTSGTLTLLTEIKNLTASGANPYVYANAGDGGAGTPQFGASNSDTIAEDGEIRRRLNPTGFSNPQVVARTYFGIAAGGSASFDARCSLFMDGTDAGGNRVAYAGPWKPYSGALLYASQAQLSVEADRITAEVSARESGDNALSSSITQTASGVRTYAEGLVTDAKDALNAVYGTCSTAAGTKAKTCSIADYEETDGKAIAVKFANANTASAPTLNVSSKGAHPIVDESGTAVGSGAWAAGETVEFVYDGTNWVMQGALGKRTYATQAALDVTNGNITAEVSARETAVNQLKAVYGTSSTAAGTVAKASSISDFALSNGATVSIKFANANTAASPTLNVSSTGAKPIVDEQGNRVGSGAWAAGETVTFVYDGTNWVMQGALSKAGDAALEGSYSQLRTTVEQNAASIETRFHDFIASGANMLVDTDVDTYDAVNADYPRARDTRTGVTVGFAQPANPPVPGIVNAHRWQITADAESGWMNYSFYNRVSGTEQHGFKLTAGEKYTMGVWVYGSYANRAKGRLTLYSNTDDGDSASATFATYIFDIPYGWHFFRTSGECPETRKYRAYFGVNPQGSAVNVWMCGFVLVEGVPSGEYDTLIRETSAGVEVGKVDSSGSYVGARSLVSSAGAFQVLDASGTVLSSMDDTTIALGADAKNSRIEMCEDALVVRRNTFASGDGDSSKAYIESKQDLQIATNGVFELYSSGDVTLQAYRNSIEVAGGMVHLYTTASSYHRGLWLTSTASNSYETCYLLCNNSSNNAVGFAINDGGDGLAVRNGTNYGNLADWVVEEYEIPESGSGTTSHTIGGYVRKWASGIQEALRIWEGTRTVNTAYDGFYVSGNQSYQVVPSANAYAQLDSASFSIQPVDGTGIYFIECTGITSLYQATARIFTTPSGAAAANTKYFRIEQRSYGRWK